MALDIMAAFTNEPPELDFIWPGFLAGTVGALAPRHRLQRRRRPPSRRAGQVPAAGAGRAEGREPQRQQEQAAQKAASRSRRKIKAWSVEQDKEKILAELNEYLTEDRDRKLFNL